jgi:hypothetical protein
MRISDFRVLAWRGRFVEGLGDCFGARGRDAGKFPGLLSTDPSVHHPAAIRGSRLPTVSRNAFKSPLDGIQLVRGPGFRHVQGPRIND